MVTFRVDDKSLQQWLNLLSPKEAEKLNVLTINKLAARARALTKAGFCKVYNVAPSVVKVQVSRASVQKPRAIISGRVKPYALYRFKPTETPSGVEVSIKRGQSLTIPGGFIEQPHGIDYKSRGQQHTKSRKVPVVLQRSTAAVYPLKGEQALVPEDMQASLGRYVVSPENVAAVNAMISKEAPALLRATLLDQQRRRSAKALGISPKDLDI